MNRRETLQALIYAATLPTLSACYTPPHLLTPPARASATPSANEPPALAREFRAAWVASVANIDWPSRPGLSANASRDEISRIVDVAASLKLNALIVQIRPAGDALYASSLEPWSEYLTGEQGRAPEAGFDPLKFWIETAHARGIAIHAWFNPFRAQHSSAKTPLHPLHLARRVPEAVVKYGDMLWMDPSHPAAREHSLAVIADVVRRYDIDGVHVDDYFYPYPVEIAAADGKKSEMPFPDDASWGAYVLRGGNLTRADWRRTHVDGFVEQLYAMVKREKRHVRVGISPFGIGRPDRRPPGIVGFSQYDKLFADVEKWLDKGWLDYCAPQLYWPIAQTEQAFEPLLQYWISQNKQGRHMWPGLFTSRAGEAWPAEEIANQVDLVRKFPQANGHIHFSMKALMENRGGVADLLRGRYVESAANPAAMWLDARAPKAPILRTEIAKWKERQHEYLSIDNPRATGIDAVESVLLVVWMFSDGRWKRNIFPSTPGNLVVISGGEREPMPEQVVVSALSRAGVESARVAWKPAA
jgi:uncharacterized lipoprotein YddW (UPF0748 family)